MKTVTLGFDAYLDFAGEDEILLSGTRVGLEQVVEAYENGASAEEIAWRYPAASLDQIHAAIAYYLSRKEDVRAYMTRLQVSDVTPTTRMVNELRQKLDERHKVLVENGRIRIVPPSP
jgi:uncharacterized protein (DUF433 family)